MKTKSTLALAVLALCALLIFAGCKKNNPTVVGIWKFANYSSYYINYNTNNTDTVTATYTYNPQTGVLTDFITRSSVMPHFDTVIRTVHYSIWNIQSNGNYSINESVDSGSAGTSYGTWEYLSNSTADNAITFSNGGSYLFQLTQSKPLNIQSITANQLVLTNNSSYIDSSGGFSNTTSAITLTR